MRTTSPEAGVKIIELSINYLRPYRQLDKQIQALYQIREVFTSYDSSGSFVWDYEAMGNPSDYSTYKNNMEMCLGHLGGESVSALLDSLQSLAKKGPHLVVKFKAIQLFGELTSEPMFTYHRKRRTLTGMEKEHRDLLLDAIELPEKRDPHPAIEFMLGTANPEVQLNLLLRAIASPDPALVEWSLRALEQSRLLDLPENRVQFVLRITELMRRMREEKVDEEWMPLYTKLKKINRAKGGEELPDLPSNLDHLIQAPREVMEQIRKQKPPRAGHIPRPRPDREMSDGFRKLAVYNGGKK